MSRSIIKSDSVRIERANLEEFTTSPQPVIRSSDVRLAEEDEAKKSLKKSRNIISGSDVRIQSERIEICQFDFSSPQEPSIPHDPIEEEALEEQESVNQEQLEELKAQLEEEWQKKVDEAVENAQKTAFEEGYNRAKEQYEKKAENSKKEFERGLDRIKESWENYLKRSETILMQIALDITQFIIDMPLPKQYSDITERILNDALDQLSRETPLTLSLNPLDLLRLQESGMMDVIKDKFPALRWDPQPTLKEGNWIIQTPQQAIRRISDELLHHLKDQFGLLEHSQPETDINSTLPGYELEYIPPVTNVAVSTTPAPLNQQSPSSGPASISAPIDIDNQPVKNAIFSPATSTANNSTPDIPRVSDLPDSDS
ncbi:MAG: hypothetical protein KTR29_03625 [Rhodothermaceae bacterium]|nr:hypothetical protein [Rhodothermaceae bacterium]